MYLSLPVSHDNVVKMYRVEENRQKSSPIVNEIKNVCVRKQFHNNSRSKQISKNLQLREFHIQINYVQLDLKLLPDNFYIALHLQLTPSVISFIVKHLYQWEVAKLQQNTSFVTFLRFYFQACKQQNTAKYSKKQQKAAKSSKKQQKAAKSSKKQQKAAKSSKKQQKAAKNSKKQQKAAKSSQKQKVKSTSR